MQSEIKDQIIQEIRSRVDIAVERRLNEVVREQLDNMLREGAATISQQVIIGLLQKGLKAEETNG